jgi:C4-dicarboxylate-specific signal transduction histidine kinase
VEIELIQAAGLPSVEIDRIPVEQVLINVIGNAADAMASNAPGDRHMRIETAQEGASVCLRVVDCGVGLPEKPERVFEPFYTTKREGLGMGLAISRSIIDAHGGRLHCARNAERGSTFHICLPIEAQESNRVAQGLPGR